MATTARSTAASRLDPLPGRLLRSRRTFAYLLAQGILLDVWLLLLWQFPTLRRVFLPIQGPDNVLLSHAWPDFMVASTLSLIAAVLIVRGSRFALATTWMVAGAMLYSAVRALGWATFTGFSWSAVALLVPLALGSLWAARHVTYRLAASPPVAATSAARPVTPAAA